jgi:FHS family glucose/mannose:H+ symporter-like MFS transporter
MQSSVSASRTIPVGKNATVLLHIDFLVTGIVMTFLGPMLPILSNRWSIDDALAGRLLFTQFLSSMFGMLSSAPLVQRRGYRLTFIVGLALMACGMALLASGPYWLGVVAVAVFGFGHGITTPAGNLRTADVNPERSASALSVINAVWGLGAMSSPFLLMIARGAHHPEWFLYGISFTLLVLLIFFAAADFAPSRHTVTIANSAMAGGAWDTRVLPMISLLFFIYVGTEQSFGSWVATYSHRVAPENQTFWTMAPAFFYGALLFGRVLAPLALRSRRETTVAKAGLALALAGGITLVGAHSAGRIAVGAMLAGLGLASIFPISVALLPGWFGAASRRASGVVFASGNMGGAVLPWTVGIVSTHSGSLRAAFFVPLMGALSMLIFYLTRSETRIPSATFPD